MNAVLINLFFKIVPLVSREKSLTTFYKTSKKGDFHFCSVDSEQTYIIHNSNFKNLASSSSLFIGLLKAKMSTDDFFHDASNVYCNLMCYCLFLYSYHKGFHFQVYLLLRHACNAAFVDLRSLTSWCARCDLTFLQTTFYLHLFY
jgi:hypothetical protein